MGAEHIVITWPPRRRITELDLRFERVFEEKHGAEMRDYYAPESSPDALSCRILEARAPIRGVWSDQHQTVVDHRAINWTKARARRKGFARERGRFARRADNSFLQEKNHETKNDYQKTAHI